MGSVVVHGAKGCFRSWRQPRRLARDNNDDTAKIPVTTRITSGPGGIERPAFSESVYESMSPAIVPAAQTPTAPIIIAPMPSTHWRAVAAGIVSSAIARITPTTRISVTTDKAVQEVEKKLKAGELKSQSANQEINRLKAKERQSLVTMLDNEQKSKIGKLTGEAFDFAQVRRTYPLAPEITSDGVTWIQGGPLSLEQLRGKVIAVHFYAFQCINCQRNLPHYKAWHDDYADKDLVIIGIQTPETAPERQIDRVTAAAKTEGIEYPIIMDAQSSNWTAWSNTMWPTVYLIDKQGFIRRWWQGEMNWQGTPGEQQMRETIEKLLAEES